MNNHTANNIEICQASYICSNYKQKYTKSNWKNHLYKKTLQIYNHLYLYHLPLLLLFIRTVTIMEFFDKNSIIKKYC